MSSTISLRKLLKAYQGIPTKEWMFVVKMTKWLNNKCHSIKVNFNKTVMAWAHITFYQSKYEWTLQHLKKLFLKVLVAFVQFKSSPATTQKTKFSISVSLSTITEQF